MRLWPDLLAPQGTIIDSGLGPRKARRPTAVRLFGSRVRDEVFSVEAFDSVIEAQTVINDCKDIYNHQLPHSSQGWRTPAAFAATVTEGSQHSRPQLS
jgi:hypothetical protein